jgi:hypothetical protein
MCVPIKYKPINHAFFRIDYQAILFTVFQDEYVDMVSTTYFFMPCIRPSLIATPPRSPPPPPPPLRLSTCPSFTQFTTCACPISSSSMRGPSSNWRIRCWPRRRRMRVRCSRITWHCWIRRVVCGRWVVRRWSVIDDGAIHINQPHPKVERIFFKITNAFSLLQTLFGVEYQAHACKTKMRKLCLNAP